MLNRPTFRRDMTTRGLLARLRRDTSGNTLAMIAMATIPLAGMVGSAVDIGRGYLIKTRLQAACDAGALAARRAMGGATLDANAIAQGQNYFRVNFSTDTSGSINSAFVPSLTNDGQVQGVATVRVPMTITKIFGTEHVDLRATCEARLEITDLDVIMVLDITGSMADCPGGGCSAGEEAKILTLRQAVRDFHAEVLANIRPDSRYRIGFVPYAGNVNMGTDPHTNSPLLRAGWMVDEWTYQSREADMSRPQWQPSSTNWSSGWTEQTYGSALNSTNCTRYGNNQSFSGFSPNPTGNPTPTPTAMVLADNQPANVNSFNYRFKSFNSTTGECKREYQSRTTSYSATGRFGFRTWIYRPVSFNVVNFRNGSTITTYTSSSAPNATQTVPASGIYDMVELVNTPGSTVPGTNSRWRGCVEERDTVTATGFAPMPSGAFDLDSETLPSDRATQWRPSWGEVVFNRSGLADETTTTGRSPVSVNQTSGSGAWGCGAPSSHLASRTNAQVNTYANLLQPVGPTYHGVGMTWGVRMLSATGIYSDINVPAANGRPVARHLIFMTDGILNTPFQRYSAYGWERLDRRQWGAGNPNTNDDSSDETLLEERNRARFVALCEMARNQRNLVVWTVGFDVDAPELLTCAGQSDRYFTAATGAELRQKFREIARRIPELRLSK